MWMLQNVSRQSLLSPESIVYIACVIMKFLMNVYNKIVQIQNTRTDFCLDTLSLTAEPFVSGWVAQVSQRQNIGRHPLKKEPASPSSSLMKPSTDIPGSGQDFCFHFAFRFVASSIYLFFIFLHFWLIESSFISQSYKAVGPENFILLALRIYFPKQENLLYN